MPRYASTNQSPTNIERAIIAFKGKIIGFTGATFGQSGTTVTASAAVFANHMVGATLQITGEVERIITNVISTSQVTVGSSGSYCGKSGSLKYLQLLNQASPTNTDTTELLSGHPLFTLDMIGWRVVWNSASFEEVVITDVSSSTQATVGTSLLKPWQSFEMYQENSAMVRLNGCKAVKFTSSTVATDFGGIRYSNSFLRMEGNSREIVIDGGGIGNMIKQFLSVETGSGQGVLKLRNLELLWESKIWRTGFSQFAGCPGPIP